MEKWKSWKLLEGVSENKAMKTYIRKVREIIYKNKICKCPKVYRKYRA